MRCISGVVREGGCYLTTGYVLTVRVIVSLHENEEMTVCAPSS